MKKSTFIFLLVCNVVLFAQSFKGFQMEDRSNPLTISIGRNNPDMTQYNLSMIPRFAPFFTSEVRFHYGFGHFGLFGGPAIRNVGYIYKSDSLTFKKRVYTSGLMAALRVGFKTVSIYAGGEYGLAVHFKEKTFVGDVKTRDSEWFSDKTSLFIPSVFAGVTYKYIDLKSQYYFQNLLKTSTNVSTVSQQIIAFSISLNRLYFKNKFGKGDKKETPDGEEPKKPKFPWMDDEIKRTSIPNVRSKGSNMHI
jgi:hypothetical protein